MKKVIKLKIEVTLVIIYLIMKVLYVGDYNNEFKKYIFDWGSRNVL